MNGVCFPLALGLVLGLHAVAVRGELTVVTHGVDLGGAVSNDLRPMAAALTTRLGHGTSIYDVVVERVGVELMVSSTLVSGPEPWSAESNGQIGVVLIYSEVSTGGFPGHDIGAAVGSYLLSHEVIPGRPWLESDVHLVGYSRGGTVLDGFAERLGQSGVWLDHATGLDPHPVDGIDEPTNFPPFDFGDRVVTRWENIVYFDNYWREDGPTDDPNGAPVDGAYNVRLSDETLRDYGLRVEHFAMPHWYTNTIDLDRPSPESWYQGAEGPRDQIGFAYSRQAETPRPLEGIGKAFGGNAISQLTRP